MITGGIVAPGTLPTNDRHPLAGCTDATRERRFLQALGALVEKASSEVDEAQLACDHAGHDEPT